MWQAKLQISTRLCIAPKMSKVDFFEAFRIAEILWIIYDALAQYRLRLACDKERFLSFQQHGKLASSLKKLINSLE